MRSPHVARQYLSICAMRGPAVREALASLSALELNAMREANPRFADVSAAVFVEEAAEAVASAEVEVGDLFCGSLTGGR